MSERKTTVKEKILQTAMRLFAEKGYFQTTVDEVVESAGASKGGFYFHFPSKESIFIALMDQLAEMLWQKIEKEIEADPTPQGRIRRAIEVSLKTFEKHKELTRIVMVEARVASPLVRAKQQEVFRRFARNVETYISEMVERGEIAPVNSELASWMFFGTIQQVVEQWLIAETPTNLLECADELILYNLKGLGVKHLVHRR